MKRPSAGACSAVSFLDRPASAHRTAPTAALMALGPVAAAQVEVEGSSRGGMNTRTGIPVPLALVMLAPLLPLPPETMARRRVRAHVAMAPACCCCKVEVALLVPPGDWNSDDAEVEDTPADWNSAIVTPLGSSARTISTAGSYADAVDVAAGDAPVAAARSTATRLSYRANLGGKGKLPHRCGCSSALSSRGIAGLRRPGSAAVNIRRVVKADRTRPAAAAAASPTATSAWVRDWGEEPSTWCGSMAMSSAGSSSGRCGSTSRGPVWLATAPTHRNADDRTATSTCDAAEELHARRTASRSGAANAPG